MKTENIITLLPFVLFTVMIAFLIQQFYFPVPDFKAGDCVAYVYEATEFTPRHTSQNFKHIVKVGRYNYLTVPYFVNQDGEVGPSYREFEEMSIQLYDGVHTKVDCNTGEEL